MTSTTDTPARRGTRRLPTDYDVDQQADNTWTVTAYLDGVQVWTLGPFATIGQAVEILLLSRVEGNALRVG